MGRKQGKTLENIRRMCVATQLEEQALYQRTRLLLKMYRDICWAAIQRSEDIKDDFTDYYGGHLDTTLVYLETMAPDEVRMRAEEQISNLVEARWLMRLVEHVMSLVQNYPDQGELYYCILSKCYLGEHIYQEQELLEILNMERSCYYDRKREAILLFGLTLWGIVIPNLRKNIHKEK